MGKVWCHNRRRQAHRSPTATRLRSLADDIQSPNLSSPSKASPSLLTTLCSTRSSSCMSSLGRTCGQACKSRPRNWLSLQSGAASRLSYDRSGSSQRWLKLAASFLLNRPRSALSINYSLAFATATTSLEAGARESGCATTDDLCLTDLSL